MNNEIQAIAHVRELHVELQAAGMIISTMLQHLTLAQKTHISVELEERGVITDGMTRHHEREAMLSRAAQFLTKTGDA